MNPERQTNISIRNPWVGVDWYSTLGGLSLVELRSYGRELNDFIESREIDFVGLNCMPLLLGIWGEAVTKENTDQALRHLHLSQREYTEKEVNLREDLIESFINTLK